MSFIIKKKIFAKHNCDNILNIYVFIYHKKSRCRYFLRMLYQWLNSHITTVTKTNKVEQCLSFKFLK